MTVTMDAKAGGATLILERSDGGTLRIHEKPDLIARGGEGTVFSVPGSPDLVAKVYHQPGDRRAKIDAMIANPPSDDATPGHVSITWPLDVLFKGRIFAGYLMKRIPKATSIHSAIHPGRRAKEHPHMTLRYLLTIGSNLASAFSALHARSYVFGDVNESNVLVTDTALVTCVDTDSFQVPNPKGGFFRCGVGREEFTPPELQTAPSFADVDRRVEHDRFSMAVLLFQLLMEGSHPYAGVELPPADNWSLGQRILRANFPFGPVQSPLARPPRALPFQVVHPGLRELFLRCFHEGQRNPSARPSAPEWRTALVRATNELATCARSPRHLYGKHLSSCPWCEREAMLLARATARTAATSLGAQVSLPGRASSVVALPAASRAAPAPNRSTMSPQWQKLSQQWGGVQQGAQMLGPAQRQQLAQQWQSVQAQHASLQQGWAQLSQQQAYEEEQRQLLAAQAVLQQAMRDLEDARARQNAEIKPGVWRLTANNPEAQAFSMVGGAAYFVELLPDGSFRGRFDMSMLGGTAQAQVSGTWGYDYSQRIFDLVGMAGSPQLGGMLAGLGPQPQMMPTAFQMRFFVQPGPGPAYAAIFADDRRQWLIQRVG